MKGKRFCLQNASTAPLKRKGSCAIISGGIGGPPPNDRAQGKPPTFWGKGKESRIRTTTSGSGGGGNFGLKVGRLNRKLGGNGPAEKAPGKKSHCLPAKKVRQWEQKTDGGDALQPIGRAPLPSLEGGKSETGHLLFPEGGR